MMGTGDISLLGVYVKRIASRGNGRGKYEKFLISSHYKNIESFLEYEQEKFI